MTEATDKQVGEVRDALERLEVAELVAARPSNWRRKYYNFRRGRGMRGRNITEREWLEVKTGASSGVPATKKPAEAG
jgi:hypothetical protein